MLHVTRLYATCIKFVLIIEKISIRARAHIFIKCCVYFYDDLDRFISFKKSLNK
jgi:hypothetical protein